MKKKDTFSFFDDTYEGYVGGQRIANVCCRNPNGTPCLVRVKDGEYGHEYFCEKCGKQLKMVIYYD